MWQQEGGKAAPVGLSSLLYKQKMQRNMLMWGVALYLSVRKFKSTKLQQRANIMFSKRVYNMDLLIAVINCMTNSSNWLYHVQKKSSNMFWPCAED